MYLYMFHCGHHVKEHIYEQHVNFFIVAEDRADANKRIKERIKIEEKAKDINIHIDSVIKIESVGGFKISPTPIKPSDEISWEQISGEITD